MNTKMFLAGLLIVLKLSLLGCAVATVDTIESGDRATEQSRVLIATQNSDFKQAVIQAIQDTLENNSSYIKVIDVKKLPYETTEGYDAVIILNKCMAGRPDPRVESFIDDTTEKEKLVAGLPVDPFARYNRKRSIFQADPTAAGPFERLSASGG